MLNPSHDKNAEARTVVGRREKSLLCDPGSELLLIGGREKRRAKLIRGMEKTKAMYIGCIASRRRSLRATFIFCVGVDETTSYFTFPLIGQISP